MLYKSTLGLYFLKFWEDYLGQLDWSCAPGMIFNIVIAIVDIANILILPHTQAFMIAPKKWPKNINFNIEKAY